MSDVKEYLYTDYIREQIEKNISFQYSMLAVVDNALEQQKIKSKFTLIKQIFRIKYNKIFY